MPLFEEEYEVPKEIDDKNRLFETHQKASRSLGSYIKLILIVSVGVAIVAVVIGYLTLPGVGDAVKSPAGLDDAVRLHFLDNEKRDPTDMTSYMCDQYYWVRVGVTKRPDIPSMPNNLIAKYRAKAVERPDGKWDISAAPILVQGEDVPCQF
jgi:hypothetical protein